MSRTSLAGLSADRGSRARGWLQVPGVDPVWEIPAVVIRGSQDGPTLAVTAGMHAAEYVPIEAVTQLTRWLDPSRLRGTVLAVPLVNTPGFYQRSIYVNPRDGKNLNRVFPGNPAGTDSERVAAFLLEELVAGSDAYVDAHCGDLIEALSPFCVWLRSGDAAVAARSRAMAASYGFEHSLGVDPKAVPGAAYAAAAAMGVPAIIAEIGQQGICDAPSVERHLRGLQNVLAELAMVDPVGPPPPPPLDMDRMVWMRAEVAASFHPTVAVGDEIAEGQPVGHLRDVFGDTLQELISPAGGAVVFLVTAMAVGKGDPLLGIGVPRASS